jgi:metal-responsive CopG/Arc/MetJ family transcriptional regulator
MRKPAGKHFTVRIEADLWPYVVMLTSDDKKNTRTKIINQALRYYIQHMEK